MRRFSQWPRHSSGWLIDLTWEEIKWDAGWQVDVKETREKLHAHNPNAILFHSRGQLFILNSIPGSTSWATAAPQTYSATSIGMNGSQSWTWNPALLIHPWMWAVPCIGLETVMKFSSTSPAQSDQLLKTQVGTRWGSLFQDCTELLDISSQGLTRTRLDRVETRLGRQ